MGRNRGDHRQHIAAAGPGRVRLATLPWSDLPGMDRLLRALDASGGQTRIVGGAVRDTLLGLPVSDFDLATQLAPDEVVRRIEAAGIKAVPTGIAHGTITAVVGGRPIEVTTLRRDVETDGRHAVVAFTDAWHEDAARRDFTINAFYADALTGEVFDFFGGEADIACPRVRFIGDPLRRIAEDHLRILRFFRFHARFGNGAPDAEGLAACAARANDLMALSRERIADELIKLLALPDPAPTVALMAEAGVLAPVLPEIGSEGVAALNRLVADEVRLGIVADPMRRLAALLPADPRVADAVAARLRMSKARRARLVCAAGRSASDATAMHEAQAYRLGPDCAGDRILLGATPDAGALARLSTWERPKLAISGGALIARGLPAGPIVAETLRHIEEAWVEAGFPVGEDFDAIVARYLAAASRESQ